MSLRSWIRKRFARPVTRTIRNVPRRARLAVEVLEERTVPSTFLVTNTLDTGAGSLRNAIAQANATVGADTIAFDNTVFKVARTITLTSGQLTLTDSATTTISGPGANLLSISGNNASRVFNINAGASAALSGLTITGGKVTGAGSQGGGVSNSGTLTMTDCTVSGNTASFQGGGIQTSGSLTLTQCVVSGNSATSSGSGGGINAQGSGPLIATDTVISGNSATFAGGGLAANGTVRLTGCTISGNTSSQSAGGILEYASTMTLTNCTVSGNHAAGAGGGVYMRFGSLDLTDVTISANTANSGGGISNTTATGDLTIGNTIVSANTATTAPDIVGTITSDSGFNLFGAALSSPSPGPGDVFSDAPLLAPLGNYGGPTQTLLPLAGSPAVGAGNNSGGPSTDQRGFARVTSAGGDIGADEGQLFTVTNTNDAGAGSLRDEVARANATVGADTIAFDNTVFSVAQTITLTSGQLTLTDSATTTIIGPGANLLSISGHNASRVFQIVAGASAALSGLTITDGNVAGQGGGLDNSGSLTLTNCTVSGNTARNGGFGRGGGLYNSPGGTLTLTSCTISGNTASYLGGGLCNFSTSTSSAIATLTNCTVSGNTAINSGGIISAGGVSATLTMTDCTINGNTGSDGNAGVSASFGVATLTNCTISGNSGGSGVTCYHATVTLTNCTVSGNSNSNVLPNLNSANRGGGVFSDSTTTLNNTIVAGNTAGIDPDVCGAVTGSNNLIGNGTGMTGISDGVNHNQVGTSGSPINPELGLLQDNGGPTQTMALLLGSPAIDAGNNALIPAGVTTDQRGFPRVVDGIVDIGAFESNLRPHVITVSAGDGQSAGINTPFGVALAVTVIDASNRPVSGVLVTFDSVSGGSGAGVTFVGGATAVTDANGVAVKSVVANGFANTPVDPFFQVIATVGGGSAHPAVFVLSNSPFDFFVISGDPSVQQGVPYTLHLSTPGVQDPALVTGWTINFGDGTTLIVPGNPSSVTHTFTNAPNNLTITARATIARVGTFPASNTVLLNVLTPQVVATASDHAGPGDQVTVAIPGAVTSIVATLTVDDHDQRDLTVFIATDNGNPAPVAIAGAAFFDVRVSTTIDGQPLGTVPPDTTLLVTFQFPPVSADETLLFFDPATNSFQPVVSGPLPNGAPTSDPTDGRFTALFTRDSFPEITELGGTVFTIAVPFLPALQPTIQIEATIDPTVALALVPVQASQAVARPEAVPFQPALAVFDAQATAKQSVTFEATADLYAAVQSTQDSVRRPGAGADDSLDTPAAAMVTRLIEAGSTLVRESSRLLGLNDPMGVIRLFSTPAPAPPAPPEEASEETGSANDAVFVAREFDVPTLPPEICWGDETLVFGEEPGRFDPLELAAPPQGSELQDCNDLAWSPSSGMPKRAESSRRQATVARFTLTEEAPRVLSHQDWDHEHFWFAAAALVGLAADRRWPQQAGGQPASGGYACSGHRCAACEVSLKRRYR